MTPNPKAYGSPTAVESAIKAAAKKVSAEDHAVSVSERIRREHFRRFLTRVFLDAEDSGWVLKGGTSILARIPAARATTDVDLLWEGSELDGALAELRRLVEEDIGDYFRFSYRGHRPLTGKEQQARVEGYQVGFDTYLGAKKVGSFHVDLVVGSLITAPPQLLEPAGALRLPRLPSAPYRLYPVVDQVADKVCATLAVYSGSESSRERDLVDLVVLATTDDFDAARLNEAILKEAQHRLTQLPPKFTVPRKWGAGYMKAAKGVPACLAFPTVREALDLMAVFLDPILQGHVSEGHWSHDQLQWSTD